MGNPGILMRLMTEAVGSGPKTADDMSREQAGEALRAILTGVAHPVTVGAFLCANRWKHNTWEELAGYIEAMRSYQIRTAPARSGVVDCGANYDGKTRTALLGVAAGLVAAAAGVPVALHSGDRIPTKYGCTYTHVLDALGVPTDLSPEESARSLETTGFGFYYQPRYNPRFHALLDYRNHVGVRTFLNTIERLANPADAHIHLGSFFHLPFARKIIRALTALRSCRYERILLFQGLEGYDDLNPRRTKMVEWRDGAVREFELEPATLGFTFTRKAVQVKNLPETSARITREVLSGARRDHFANAVALNAALRIYAGSDQTSLGEALAVAQSVIQGGQGMAVLEQLQSLEESGTTACPDPS